MTARLPDLVLSDGEQEPLICWPRRRMSSQAVAMLCRIAMAFDDAKNNTAVAQGLNVTNLTVGE